MTPINDKEGTEVKGYRESATDANGVASPTMNTPQISTRDSHNTTNEHHLSVNFTQISTQLSKITTNETLSLSDTPQISTQPLLVSISLTEESQIYTKASQHSTHLSLNAPKISPTTPQVSTSASQLSINTAQISTSRPCSPRSAVVTILSGTSPSQVRVTVLNPQQQLNSQQQQNPQPQMNQLPVEIHSSQNGEGGERK